MRKALLNLLASLGIWTMLLILIHYFPSITELVCAWFAILIVYNLQGGESKMITIMQQRKLEEKSKTKKDGIYTYQGIYYKVIGNRLRYTASHGEVLECFGNF